MDIGYTRQPTVTTDKNGYTEDQQNQYITNTAKELVKKDRKVQEEELSQDKNWIDSAKVLYQMQEDSEGELPNDEALSKWALDYVGQTQYNLVSGANAALEFQDADDMQKIAMRYAMETYDMKDITLAGVGRLAKGLATDPTTYIGLGSFGVGFGAKAATSVGAKKAFMTMLSKTSNLAAIEGAAYGGLESGIQQSMEVSTGARDKVDMGEVALTAGIGAVAGKGLGEAIEYVGKKFSKADTQELQQEGQAVAQDIKANIDFAPELLGGTVNGLDYDEEKGEFSFDPVRFMEGFLGGHVAKKIATNPKLNAKAKKEALDYSQRLYDKYKDKPMFKYLTGSHSVVDDAPGVAKPKMKVMHNLSQSNLEFVDKYFNGEIPAPSVAITDEGVPFESFGEISLFGDKELINPKLSANKVFGADAYTKRTPRASFKPNIENKRAIEKIISTSIEESIKKLNRNTKSGKSKISELSRAENIIEDKINRVLEGSDNPDQAAKNILRFDVAKNIYKEQTGQKYSDKKANEWWTEQFSSIRGESEFNTSGDWYNKKMKPYTSENLVKFIKKYNVKNSEGFNYGVPSTRAEGLKELKSFKAIQDRTTPLVTAEEMDTVKDVLNNKFFDLKTKLEPYSKYRDVDDDALTEIIAGFMNDREASALTKDFDDIPDELVSELKSFGVELATAPTQYYEAKLMRAVDLDEFKGALIPKGTPKNIVKILKDKGIKVQTYSGDRQLAEKSFLDKNKEWLFVVPPLMLLGAENDTISNQDEEL